MNPAMVPPTDILQRLGASAWSATDRERAHQAAALAITIYSDHTRDQGTPYIHHPLAVVTILRDELEVTDPPTLLLGLLHDALEVAPSAAAQITTKLGADLTAQLRAMTPDHRLEQRPKAASDESAWRTKTAHLAPEALLVRLADRLHNLRDLAHSPNPDRRRKFLTALTDCYLPLAEAASPTNPRLKTAHRLLVSEYERAQQGERP